MVNVAGMALMVVSNAVSWHAVAKSLRSLDLLRSVVWKIALFYALWALYNRLLGGNSRELGHVSMGLLALSCLATAHSPSSCSPGAARAALVASCGLVVLNFAAVLPMIVGAGGPAGFAKKVRDSGDASALVAAWGYTFAAYIASNVGMWSLVFARFATLPMNGRSGFAPGHSDPGFDYPTIEEGAYQPVQTADL